MLQRKAATPRDAREAERDCAQLQAHDGAARAFSFDLPVSDDRTCLRILQDDADFDWRMNE
jgi:hypothetical protein